MVVSAGFGSQLGWLKCCYKGREFGDYAASLFFRAPKESAISAAPYWKLPPLIGNKYGIILLAVMGFRDLSHLKCLDSDITWCILLAVKALQFYT
jgi:hypothetical protein